MGTYVDMNKCKERLYTVLDRVGYLSVEQAEKINYNKVLACAAIRELCREKRAFMTENRKFLIRQPWRKPWMPVIQAVDVMLAFLNNIDVSSIFVKPYQPKAAQQEKHVPEDRLLLGFAKNGRLYEIYAAKDRQALEELYEYLHERHKRFLETGGSSAEMRYLIMVPNESLFLYAGKDTGYLFAFACVEKTASGVSTQFYNPCPLNDVEESGRERELCTARQSTITAENC